MRKLFQTIRNYQQEVNRLQDKLPKAKQEDRALLKKQISFYKQIIELHKKIAAPCLEKLNLRNKTAVISYYYKLKSWETTYYVLYKKENDERSVPFEALRKEIERSLDELSAPNLEGFEK